MHMKLLHLHVMSITWQSVVHTQVQLLCCYMQLLHALGCLLYLLTTWLRRANCLSAITNLCCCLLAIHTCHWHRHISQISLVYGLYSVFFVGQTFLDMHLHCKMLCVATAQFTAALHQAPWVARTASFQEVFYYHNLHPCLC